MNYLELFSGTESVGRVFRENGWNTFTIDNNPIFLSDLCADILDLNADEIRKYIKPDVIWASPPCTFFSVASIGKHWNIDNTPKTEQAAYGVRLIEHTVKLIADLNPTYWFIENPRGKLRSLNLIGGIRHTVSYCQYGDDRMKPTDIWTNNENWQPRPICKNGDKCHTAAPRGSKTGTQGRDNATERGRIPKELGEEILLSCIQGRAKRLKK
jgi:site-specific DNA-cytosine methylase